MIQINITGEKLISNSTDSFSLYEKSSFGEKKEGKIEYSGVEALFLLSESKAVLSSNSKNLTFEEAMKRIKKTDKRIETKFTVFKDMRKRGYILKTALKYGSDFRVYEKGVKPGEEHAHWILFCTKENDVLAWQDFAAKNRIAHSVKKNLLIAIIDEESDVSYYEISWKKF